MHISSKYHFFNFLLYLKFSQTIQPFKSLKLTVTNKMILVESLSSKQPKKSLVLGRNITISDFISNVAQHAGIGAKNELPAMKLYLENIRLGQISDNSNISVLLDDFKQFDLKTKDHLLATIDIVCNSIFLIYL